MAHAANLTTSCTRCTDPDDGTMVTCSKCLSGYHGTCCDVDTEADIFPWTCQDCKQNSTHNLKPSSDDLGVEVVEQAGLKRAASNSATMTQSTTVQPDISAKKQLQLQQLEEEMQLKEEEIRLKREFIKRKYELLRSNEEYSNFVDNVRPVSNNNKYSTLNIPPCVNNCQQTLNNSGSQNNGEYSDSNVTQHIIHNDTHNDCECLSRTQPRSMNSSNTPQCQSGVINNVNDRKVNAPPVNQQNKTNISAYTSEYNNCKNITTTQLMARQCIARDLPSFNGDPREWPIFISSFEQSTRVAGYGNEENLIRLQKCLHGKARDAVRNCLMLPDMVPDIIRTLKMYFGRPECILKNLIDEVRKTTLPKCKLESLIEFAFAVKNICATIRASQLDEYFNNPTLLQELVDKLSPDTVLQWAMHSKDIPRPNLKDFSDWLYCIAEATCRVTVPVFETSHDKRPPKREGHLNTHTTFTSHKPQQQCILCNEIHKLAKCEKFTTLSTAERWDVVKSKNLCRICLGNHRRRCWFQKECGINGCNVLHNTLLHSEQPTSGTLNNHQSNSESYFRIVPVTLYSDTKSVKIYALMDDGSTLTLLEEKVADSLGVKGINDPLCIRWTGDVSRYEEDSKRINLKISSTKYNAKIFPINNVYTVKNLNLPAETMIVQNIKKTHPYLADIPLEGYNNVTPSMIIGVNNPKLISSLKTREGGWQQPVASKTRLGWTLFGGVSKVCGRLNFHKCSCDELQDLVRTHFSDESVGITPPATEPMSKDDQKATEILEQTCKFIDGRYEVGLLWKCDQPELPHSLPTAIKRFHCIRRKANRDPKLAEVLQQQILNLEEKGYAERLPLSSLEGKGDKIWYLPTFIVKNPHKPDKIRLVWDAAAKTGEFALNDFLLRGPDLLMPLMNILFKFRMGAVAICGDIAEMFHRIKVRKEDACAQRFLWWDNNSMVVYQLNVLTFGASCSPCISHYVRDKNAQTFCADEKVVDAITKQHYVDDFIDSTNTVEEAIDLALSVRDVHASGGFHMRNWSSNSSEVLNALGETKCIENKTFENGENSIQFEKILGLYWDPKNDTFQMNLKFVRLRRPILNEEIVPTKREVLQVLMSVFDPLGFVACFMSYLKSILQEIWRCGIDWDQPLTDELYSKWKNWLTFLPTIAAVSIPRCYSISLQQQKYLAELHTFVDASEDAYAAVSFFRIEFSGNVEIRLVAAKAKVAPLRPLSVPRLELQAAVIGARLMQTVSFHNINLQRKVMWTDSKTVLNWLTGDPRKYKQFVMFRVAEILKFTNASDWRWVPGTMNVADFATKYRPPTNDYKTWFDGPTWLALPESEWPKNSDVESNLVDVDISEIRPRYINIHMSKPIKISINFEYFSSWFRLYRAVGNWLVYIERRCQKSKKQKPEATLNGFHLTKAKQIIYKMIQISSFADEYAAILSSKAVSKGGAFDKLNVYMDEDGVIRVKNRAQYATAACGPQRDLIVLPGNHHATKLIVNSFHRAYHHLNHETVINEIRQIYFIVKLRVLYKIIRRECQQCKNEYAKPFSPQMSPLPPARLGAFQRPFTYVGVDYFGPIAVTFGRKSLKRWGVIFTCLTIRAVHIEIAHTLSTDSLLMILRNFMSRRGIPAEIYSDNGTNFRGADRFLKEELKNIKFDDIHFELSHKGIVWKFNPPAAPHMGGAWERLVRSIKTILWKITPSQKFTDESLRCALMEVEMIVNSRPLTYVSLETEDQEAITPNHFLLGSSNGAKPFCRPENVDHRMCLRQSEMFANLFWRRFVKEMLPTLTRRSKWTQRVKPIEENDIVLVVDENAERNSWMKGRVVEVTKAKDGQVRRAKINTKNGIMERPAVKLAVLDVGNIANDFRFNSFEEIAANAFEGLMQVTTLFLNENEISYIQEGAFDDLVSLRFLYLNYNRISKLPKNIFQKLQQLEGIYLENNNIWQIEADTFTNLPRLSRIFLSNNKLTNLPPDAFTRLPSLKRLRLDGNPIDCNCGIYSLWRHYQQLPQRQQITILLTCETPTMLYRKGFSNLQEYNFHCKKPEIVQAPHDMHLTPGEIVELPCRMVGDPEPEIIWMQNTNEVSTDYSPKIQILSSGTLKINAVDSNDIGIYECIGRNEVGETRTQPIRMMVEQGTSSNTVTNANSNNRYTSHGDYNDNNNNNNQLWNAHLNQQNNRQNTVLTRNNDNSNKNIHNNWQQPHTVSPLNHENSHQQPPTFVYTPTDRIVALNGDATRLDCVATGNPTPDIQWYFNGRLVAHSTDALRIHANGSLVIVQPSLLLAGVYRCEATNHLGAIQSSANIQVKELPEILMAPQNQTIKVGKSFVLECDADGNPIPTITWQLNGAAMVTNEHLVLENENTELIVNNARESDTGIYTCIAENENGHATASATITVERVRSAPHLIIEPYDLKAFTGTSIELPCKADESEGIQITWRKDGRIIDPNVLLTDKYEIIATGSLFIKNVTILDSGRFECSIKNEFGRATASAYVTVRNNESLAPGDRYVRIAFEEAAREIDLAINNTIDMLFTNRNRTKPNGDRAPPNYGDLLRVFRFPTGEARQLARAAEIYERTLVNIRKHVLKGDNLTIESDRFEFKDLLSREHLHLVAELSGCMEHREMPNCTDMCFHSKYRTLDGTCNNLLHPNWGASLTSFRRLEKPVYENGFSMPIGWTKNKLYAGFPKPSSRLVSTSLISTKDITPDDTITHMVMQWGQFLDHDLDHAIPSVSSESWDGIDCKKTCEFAPPCYPIEVPPNDPRIKNRRCIDVVRSISICGSGMTSVFFDSVQHREQINQLTSYIDASQVYGFSEQFANEMRNLTTDDGLMRVGVHFPNQRDMLPFAAPQDGMDCRRNLDENQMSCFVAGDIRVNEQVGLLAMHTIWMREHNRIAIEFKHINPHWDGDTIYHEARKIVGAEMQHITYKHWLPLILGESGMNKLGEYKGYDSAINPSIANEFATAALRFGHTIINPILHRLNSSFEPIPQGHLPLHKAFFAPWRLAYEGGVDALMRGMFATPAKLKTPEQNLNTELTEKLFQTAHAVALDLAAINIQRGRDHGIPGYNVYRKFCNLTEAKTFDDLSEEIISKNVREKLKELYGHPDNIDVWVGGILEEQVKGGKVGPLFQCLLVEQFKRLRDGDRFYYENPSVFLPQQLEQIKQANLGRVLCDNGDKLQDITDNVFILPSLQGGYKKCEDIPGINLYFWQDCATCSSLPPIFETYVPQTYQHNRYKRSVNAEEIEQSSESTNHLEELWNINEERVGGLEEVVDSFHKELKKLHKKIHKLEESCDSTNSNIKPAKRNHCVDDNGTTRLNNEVWSPDYCTKCECRRGQVTCTKEKCGEVHCLPGIDPITPPMACCPHCPPIFNKN